MRVFPIALLTIMISGASPACASLDPPEWLVATFVKFGRGDTVPMPKRYGYVDLRWHPVESADSYRVLRREADNGAYTSTRSTRYTRIRDAAVELDKTYYYALQSVAGKESSQISEEMLVRMPEAPEPWPIRGKVVDGFGKPVGNATVKVYLRVGHEADFENLDQPFLETTTDGAGHYSGTYTFAGRAGQRNFTVTAEKPGYYLSRDNHLSFGEHEPELLRTKGRVALQEVISSGELNALLDLEGEELEKTVRELLARAGASIVRALLDHLPRDRDSQKLQDFRTRVLPILVQLVADADPELKNSAQSLIWFLGDGEQMNAYSKPKCGYPSYDDCLEKTTDESLVRFMRGNITPAELQSPRDYRISIEERVISPFGDKAFLSVSYTKVAGHGSNYYGWFVAMLQEEGEWGCFCTQVWPSPMNEEPSRRLLDPPWEHIFSKPALAQAEDWACGKALSRCME